MSSLGMVAVLLAAQASRLAAYQCLNATNNQDTEYSVTLHVGSEGFAMHVTPDTGSYQLVLASKQCVSCEGHCMGCPEHRLFNESSSTTYHDWNETVISAYGQGQVICAAGSDFVRLGVAQSQERQAMQLIKKNDLQGFSQDSSYDGIMGLGVTDLVPVTNQVASPSVLKNLNISTFGICFSLVSGEGGRLDLGSGVPGLAYHDVPGVGVGYWMIGLRSFLIGDALVACHAWPYCNAIIDSGTTLIGLPKTILNHVVKHIGNINPDCSNVDQLPTISMLVNDGHILTLPPSAYIAQLNDLTVTQPVHVGPFVANLPEGTESACTHLFFESNINDPQTHAPVLLIGMPIFRRYAIRFSRGKGSSNQTVAPGHSIGFSPLAYDSPICSSCAATGEDGSAASFTRLDAVKGQAPSSLQPETLVSAPVSSAELGRAQSSAKARVSSYSARMLRLPRWLSTLRRDDSSGDYIL
ncbi:hypothetical protein AB1Y20_001545 [Prymnesium parvum]|uniref:Peptidase A1 domain-containing protein n=1 Tax=Prymnesium parvum TaxID=97485 RepID=A0AB34K8Y9_PRYPA